MKAAKKHASKTQLQYDAAATSKRRRSSPLNLRREDDVLKPRDRDHLISEARILRRNADVFAWAMRRHLDNVSTFSFQARTGNDAVDEQVEELIRWWSLPENCDVTGRHSFQRLIRLMDACALADGDCFIYTLSSGHLQLIEGDRIRTPNDLGDYEGKIDRDAFVHGVQTTDSGKALRYAICDRDGNSFVLRNLAQAKYLIQHGYFDRYDQVRGISPISAGINTFKDLYEAKEYALARMKLSQFFIMKLKRAATGFEGDTAAEYDIDMGQGPQSIELENGDDAEFLESAQPSTQFQEFVKSRTEAALKSIDIPYSFYDESHTNYSGARQALLMYQQSAAIKRQNIRAILERLTRWRLQLFVLDGELRLPSGMTVENIGFDWVPAGMGWVDPLKEAKADIELVNNRLKSRQEISKARGKDWWEIVGELKAEQDYLRELGISPEEADAALIAATQGDDESEDE